MTRQHGVGYEVVRQGGGEVQGNGGGVCLGSEHAEIKRPDRDIKMWRDREWEMGIADAVLKISLTCTVGEC